MALRINLQKSVPGSRVMVCPVSNVCFVGNDEEKVKKKGSCRSVKKKENLDKRECENQ